MRRLLALCIFLCWVSCCAAQSVTPGTTDAIQCTSATGTSYSKTFNIPAGPNLLAVVTLAWGNNNNGNDAISVSTITLGGSSILSDSVQASGAVSSNQGSGYYGWVQNFAVPNPTTGSSVTLAYTVSATAYRLCANIVTFTNVNQTTPIRPGSSQTANVSNLYGGWISILVPSQMGDLAFSSFAASSSGLTGAQTAAGLSASNATGYGYWGNAYQTSTAPQLLFVWGNAGASNYVGQSAFSIQSVSNSTVIKAIGGLVVGPLPGQISQMGGTNIGSAISGEIAGINGAVTPAGANLINSFFNSSGGTAGGTPTATTAGNSLLGDYGYNTWTASGIGGITFSNALSIGNLLAPVVSNDGTVNTATGTLGINCLTSATNDCTPFYDVVSTGDWTGTASLGLWFESTCTGSSTDCGSQVGLNSNNNTAGFSYHVDGVTPCSYNGFSFDATQGTGNCLTGLYKTNTLYRINYQIATGPGVTATFTSGSPVISATQTFTANQAIEFTNSGGSLPTPLAASTIYYVLPTDLSGTTFEISLTNYPTSQIYTTGIPIVLTSAGSGTTTATPTDQLVYCNAAGTVIGTQTLAAYTTNESPIGRFSIGINGEAPTSAFNFYYYGIALDGTGKFSNTECVL